MGRKNKLTIIVVLVAILYFYYHRSKTVQWGPTIKTNEGDIRGVVSLSRDGREFYSWYKIPYAQPPVGQLRFSSPKPAEKWDGVKDGSAYGSMCAQLQMGMIMGDEDCLFLNVHAPKLPKQPSLPVIVYIHGGAFVGGSADMMNPFYFMDEDILIVSLNYRVGVLGFMTTGDENIRGNMGLKDQALALKWVQRNIKNFGGDPTKVTIFGHSAGGASVHYLTLSESTRGLFRKAFAMSGTSILPWAFSPTQTAVAKTKDLAGDLNCLVDNNEKMVECLRTLDASELLKAYKKYGDKPSLLNPSKDGILFNPTVERVEDEEAFLTQSPFDVVVKGKAHRIPYISSVTKDEGLLASCEFYRSPPAMDNFEKNWDQGLQNSFYFSPRFSPQKAIEAGQKLKEFYFTRNEEETDERESKILKYTDMFGDGLFLVGASEVATVQRQFSPVYLYIFNKVESHGGIMAGFAILGDTFHPFVEVALAIWKIWWNKVVMGRPHRVYGNGHGDDAIYYSSFIPFMGIDKEDPDYQFSKDFIRMTVDFASKDDETDLKFRGVKFTPNTAKDKGPLMYLEVNEEPRMTPEPFAHRTAFWHSINYTQLFSDPSKAS